MRAARPPTADAVLAMCLVLITVGEVWVTSAVHGWLAAALLVPAAAALAWRRRAPLAAFSVAVGLATLGSVIAAPIDGLAVVVPIFAVAIYSVAAHASPPRAVTALAASMIAVVVATFAPQGPGTENLLFGTIIVGGPWLAGWLVRIRTDQAVALALRAQELERTQAEREQAAVAEERARIARELHDIIAHSVSVMTIQAGAIEEVVDREPEKARAAAGSIRRTGRRAQADLRRLLGLLREEDAGTDALSPQPGLAGLDALIASVRQAGIDVRLTVEGTPRALPPAVDLSAFRVVQEALTNTLKHARATVASVGVRYDVDAVNIEVTDDGVADAGHATGGPGSGHGLVGMRERVAVYGGELEFGRGPSGGFRVHALLPVDAG